MLSVVTPGARLGHLLGTWVGTNGMRMLPTDPFDPSPSAASVTLGANGHAVVVTYSWVHTEQAQNGVLLVSANDEPDGEALRAVWLDSWHQQPGWMWCTGDVDEAGALHLHGRYDGGRWRIHVDAGPSRDALRIVMDNAIGDDGEPYPVVEATYAPAPNA
ncbi:MAG: DUF1579 domain-containing protein [Actinomycetota bacterium]|nr:DUF1579 domain-containing protein [Actinomycetota bacterium]